MSAPVSSQLSQAEKAAAVVMAVGSNRATPMLAHLSEDEQERLALEVARLGEVSDDELQPILSEFSDEAHARRHIVHGSLDAARELLLHTRGERADEVIERLVATVRVAPFRFLRDRDPGELAQHLAEEHPQTVALVLAHLPPATAAKVLGGFEAEAQRDVAVRVATMEPPQPEVVDQVEQALQARLGDASAARYRSEEEGVRELASILNSADRTTERVILGSLESSDPQLAEQIRELMFVFEDIVKIDDRALQRVLRDMDQQTLVYALKGVRDEVADKVARNVSERAATALLEELEVLGPVRVADVEQSQSEVVRHIRQLEEAGEILVRRSNEGGDVVE